MGGVIVEKQVVRWAAVSLCLVTHLSLDGGGHVSITSALFVCQRVGQVWVLTRSPCDLLLPLCWFIPAGVIHAAAHV